MLPVVVCWRSPIVMGVTLFGAVFGAVPIVADAQAVYGSVCRNFYCGGVIAQQTSYE
jgi:hypothetical protein